MTIGLGAIISSPPRLGSHTHSIGAIIRSCRWTMVRASKEEAGSLEGRAGGEYERAEGEQKDDMVVSAGAKLRRLSQPTITWKHSFGVSIYVSKVTRKVVLDLFDDNTCHAGQV